MTGTATDRIARRACPKRASSARSATRAGSVRRSPHRGSPLTAIRPRFATSGNAASSNRSNRSVTFSLLPGSTGGGSFTTNPADRARCIFVYGPAPLPVRGFRLSAGFRAGVRFVGHDLRELHRRRRPGRPDQLRRDVRDREPPLRVPQRGFGIDRQPREPHRGERSQVVRQVRGESHGRIAGHVPRQPVGRAGGVGRRRPRPPAWPSPSRSSPRGRATPRGLPAGRRRCARGGGGAVRAARPAPRRGRSRPGRAGTASVGCSESRSTSAVVLKNARLL